MESIINATATGVPATKITLGCKNVTEITIDMFTVSELSAVLTPGNTTDTVTWATSDYRIANVLSNGRVIGKKNGVATITATATSGATATCRVNVTDKKILDVHMINQKVIPPQGSAASADGIVIRLGGNRAILIDGGKPREETGEYGADITINHLKKLGIKHLEYMIATHSHVDHVGAWPAILEEFTVGTLVFTQDPYDDTAPCAYNNIEPIKNMIEAKGLNYIVHRRGSVITMDGVRLECVGPWSHPYPDENKNSLNYLLTFGNKKMLFTGDYISVLLHNRGSVSDRVRDLDVLQYPHHGWRYLVKALDPQYANDEIPLNNGLNLIEWLKPKHVLVSSSKDVLGVPQPENDFTQQKAALESLGAEFHYTHRDGTILLITDGDYLVVRHNSNPSNFWVAQG